MKIITSLLFLVIVPVLSVLSQSSSLELTFTANNNTTHVQLDRIHVLNRTQNCDTVLFWPDTVLSLNYFRIPEITLSKNVFQVFQNYPNPVVWQTTISLYVPEKDQVRVVLTDMLGQVILTSDQLLVKGIHSFEFTPGIGNIFLFTAKWRGNISSIIILTTASNSKQACSLKHIIYEPGFPQPKTITDIHGFTFNIGDELLYIGYADNLESGISDTLLRSQTYTFKFATNIPCQGIPSVEYEGQVYHTIQIFSQCWLKENLNVGLMIPGIQNMNDNGIFEKYCYNNDTNNCQTYGGLYQWDEMMQYTLQQGTQGICPAGWHLPSDLEWKILEGMVDSQYGIDDPVWELYWESRGFDAGANLKSTSGWSNDGNGTDLFDFSGLPGGYSRGDLFGLIGKDSRWWTSTEHINGSRWVHGLDFSVPGISRGYYNEEGLSVRCLKNE